MSIIHEVTPLHIYNEYRSNDLSWKTTVAAITTNICLTKDWLNVISASVTASIWENIEKYIIK